MESVPFGAASSARLGCPVCVCCRASGKTPARGSHRGNDNHEVGRDVGNAGQKVRGQTGQVTLRELAGWEDLQHVGGLEERTRISGTPCLYSTNPTATHSSEQAQCRAPGWVSFPTSLHGCQKTLMNSFPATLFCITGLKKNLLYQLSVPCLSPGWARVAPPRHCLFPLPRMPFSHL